MKSLKLLNKIQAFKGDSRYLIDIANLKGNIINSKNYCKSKFEFKKFKNSYEFGIPFIFPYNKKIFTTINSQKFKLNQNEILNIIYRLNDINYPPFKKLYSKKSYFISSNIKLKKKYSKIVKEILRFNNSSKKKIINLKKKFKNVCAFQTRNIPHLGHEKIFTEIIRKYGHVVINPLIGPKKRGDLDPETLYKSFKFLKRNIYKDKISFIPVISNMFYAGPREACHHAAIRQSLGFTHFAVGRDHAGHGNYYKHDKAVEIIKNHRKKFKIKFFLHYGSYVSKKSGKIIMLKNKTNQDKIIDISGTEFRKKLIKKKFFIYARRELQMFLHNL